MSGHFGSLLGVSIFICMGVSDEGSFVPLVRIFLSTWVGPLLGTSLGYLIGIKIGSSDLVGALPVLMICVTIKLWFGS